MSDSSVSQGYAHSGYIPPQIHDDVDVAGCALDEQLEVLQRTYATANRASSRATVELELLLKCADIPEHMVASARRARAAAEIRCARLVSAIEILEDRLEDA